METTEIAYNGLSSCLEPDWIVEWTRDEAKAMADRGEAMRIYDVALAKGRIVPGMFLNTSDRLSMHRIQNLHCRISV